jgi:hypothetical protein
MRRYCKLATIFAALMLILSLPALADSTDSFSGEKVGGSGSSLSGSFTFSGNSSTGYWFSNLSLSFNGGVFAGITASDAAGGKATCLLGFCGFSWKAQAGSGWVWDTIVLNVATGQYWDLGKVKISDWQSKWNFDPPAPLPEGGTPLAYLMLSGLAMFAGILISRKRTRARIAECS